APRARRGALRRYRRPAEPPRGEPGDGGPDDEDGREGDDDAALEAPLRDGRAGYERRRVFVVMRDARVVLVDVQLAVEAEVLRVRPQEALRVRIAGEHVPPFFLEGGQVPLADANRLVDLGGSEAPPGPGVPEAFTDLEHATRLCQRCGEAPGQRGNNVENYVADWARGSSAASCHQTATK